MLEKLGPLGGVVTGAIRALESTLMVSLALLATRIAVGLVFWRSGQTKVDSDFNVTDTTVLLFKYEYAVPVLEPKVAAIMASYAEHALPILLWLGLGARIGATGLLVMTAVIQFFVFSNSWPEHMLWAAMLAVILTKGPGLFSIDHFIRKREMA
ncbi:MAG: DoxX family protein [Alphaproteobacteria bacterium]